MIFLSHNKEFTLLTIGLIVNTILKYALDRNVFKKCMYV